MTDVLLLPQPRRASFTGRVVDDKRPRVGTDSTLPAQGYRIRTGDSGVVVEVADDAGEYYAMKTLSQMRRNAPSMQMPEGEIEDWPDLPVRGVMIDISRDKVPSLSTLTDLVVPGLAHLKINHLELYMEHTFAYADHEAVWRDSSPFTAEEIRLLDEVCREHHIELAPNQNCLGHWERWLKHDRYRPLAIHPDGFEFFGRHRGPTTLDPADADARALVASLLEELLPNFSSRRVHVGLDEPWELPGKRFDDYLDWIRWITGLDVMRDREVLMWSDVVMSHPDRVRDLPDVTLCEWGYEADHPFATRGANLAAAGRPFWACPGTSSWLTLVGRWANMTANIASAADAAVEHGARGLLVTDWGDLGHLQYEPFSWPGYAYAAAMSWCAGTNRDIDLAAALSLHHFGDPSGNVGAALRELGLAHTELDPQVPNCSSLVLHLYRPYARVGIKATEGLTHDQLDAAAARVDAAAAHIDKAADLGATGAQMRTAITLVRVLIDDARARLAGDLTIGGIPAAERKRLADAMDGVIAAHGHHWVAYNREGGLKDSVAWLERLRDSYRSGGAAPPA